MLLVVQRKYPTIIWERLPSGVTRTHTPKAFQAAETHYETQAAKVRDQLLHLVAYLLPIAIVAWCVARTDEIIAVVSKVVRCHTCNNTC